MIRVNKYKSYKGEVGKAAENILQRNFNAENPYEKWVTDVTKFKVAGNKLYLSPIMNLFNGEIIRYNLSTSANYNQIDNILNKAFRRRAKDGKKHMQTILDSDQGWQYRMVMYQNKLKNNNITQSISRKGNCLDNGVPRRLKDV